MGMWGPAPGCPKFHRDVGTCPGMSQISQGREDMGIFPRMSPVSQGHGDLPWDVGWLLAMGTAAPWRSALPPWPVGSSSQCTQGCSQGHRWERGRAKEKKAAPGRGKRAPGPLPVPSLGMAASFPAATASGASMSMLLNYSAPAWHGAAGSCHPPHRAEGDSVSPVPIAALGRHVHWGRMVGDTWTQVEAPHVESVGLPCSGCSVPRFPHAVLDTSVSGEG